MGLIEIEGMEFYAHHGCYPEERAIGTKFIVYLAVQTNLDHPSKSDKIGDTLNYQEAYLIVKEQMRTTSNLLEHVAARILDALYGKFSGIEKATVKISKMNPPMGGNIEKVSVTLTQ
jgi:7,8-dihydroneopterin aldolase/epimerase/oxygenase